MFCAVVGKKYIWFFTASDRADGNEIANIILSFEKTGCYTTIGGSNPEYGYWKAEPKELDDEIKGLLKKIDESKIIEVKKDPSRIDVLYVTRFQKERST